MGVGQRSGVREGLLGLGLGLLALTTPLITPGTRAPQGALHPSHAAQNLVFVSGAFRRSIAVSDLEYLAQTGRARGLLVDVLALSRQNPETVAKLLNESISLPITLVSRLLNTRIGEALLQRIGTIIFPLKASQESVPALRSALILGLVEGKGSLSALSFFKAYPTAEMEVSIPALLSLMNKAGSISELVRFFSESPLDGLQGNDPPAGKPSGTGQQAGS
jgi:hypothetical protein